MTRRISLFVATMVLVVGVAGSAMAGETFKDLPGVKDPDGQKAERELDVVCTSQLERQQATRNRNGLAYRTYSCDLGRVTVGSSDAPNMIEYRKYRDRYKPWPSEAD